MGRFLMAECEKHPENSYIGIDPDYQCVKKNLKNSTIVTVVELDWTMAGSFYGSVYHFFAQCPEKSVDLAYVNYPDPWFKKRHIKRRLVTEKLFNTFYPLLKGDAVVYVQTDIDDYAEFIDEEFKNLKNYDIEYGAIEHFSDLAGTLLSRESKGQKPQSTLLFTQKSRDLNPLNRGRISA